jgi:TnpA family transposase
MRLNISEITEDQLAKDWTLSEPDIDFIMTNARGEFHQMRSSIQLCKLRQTGHFAFKQEDIPIKAANYLAQQLGMQALLAIPDLTLKNADYSRLQKIQQHLNFKDFSQAEKRVLQSWLLTQVQDYVLDQRELTSKTKAFLKLRKVVLPSPSQLGRFIASAVKNAHLELYQHITNLFPQQDLHKLDLLINNPNNSVHTELMSFKRPPPEPNAAVINQFLACFETLESLKITEINFSSFNPKVIKSLAQIAKNQSAWHLRRIKPDEKRYAILICFLVESVKTILDTIIDMHSLLLGDVERKSKNEFKNQRSFIIRDAKSSRGKTLSFAKQALAHEAPGNITLASFLATFNCGELQEAVKTCEEYEEFEEHGVINNIVKRFTYLRKYSKGLLKLNFEAAVGNKSLLEAIKILRKAHDNPGKKFPNNPPAGFLPKSWRDNLYDDQGIFQPRYWEVGVYYAMRKSLNKGDLYLTDSRHHRYFWDTVYTPQDWQEKKVASYTNLALPTEFGQMEAKLKKEFDQSVSMLQENLGKDGFATIVDERIKLCKDDALEIPPEVKKLKRQIEAAIPPVRIERLVAEVDKITQFSRAFVPLQQERNITIPKKPLYGVIVAHATNIGLYGMGQSNQDITAEVLRRTSERCVNSENIQNSNVILINCHQQYPISQVYGTGICSSSDGQRFGIQTSSMLSAYYPRFYGYYDKAISVYTHISDQYSVFNTLVISCALREATYVLDGLLLNNTDINPEFHCTDTHGYTDHLFALCYLLGISFQPRLSDLPYQALHKMRKHDRYGALDTLFTGVADLQLVGEQWDTIVRIAASLKNRIAPAHVIIQRLAGRDDKVAKALQALGRVIKTIYIFRYICDPVLRRQVHFQLNRGESRHSLAKVIFFDNRGVFKTSDYEEIMNKASCLSLVSNTVLVWNTHHMQQIVNRMRREGLEADDTILAKISPLSIKNILVHGTYSFEEIT